MTDTLPLEFLSQLYFSINGGEYVEINGSSCISSRLDALADTSLQGTFGLYKYTYTTPVPLTAGTFTVDIKAVKRINISGGEGIYFAFDYIEAAPGGAAWGADFAVKIAGDSMEPYIADGSVVYVRREPLEDGDVGIFCVDGDMLCKQYRRDAGGDVRLLSLNRKRADADRFLPRENADAALSCYGRVLLPRRPPF